MKQTEMTIDAFLDQLSSASPTPGGGSWAALSGGLGAALTSMVCSLTVGREKYQQYDGLATQSLTACTALRARFVEGIQEDIDAFNQMGQVFTMPRGTDGEKEARREAMQRALKVCTIPPIQLMELALEGLEMTRALIGQSNPTAVSDLGCAALALKSTIQGGWLNVSINLGSIRDEEFVAQYRQRGQEILDRGLPLADEIYQEVLNAL